MLVLVVDQMEGMAMLSKRINNKVLERVAFNIINTFSDIIVWSEEIMVNI